MGDVEYSEMISAPVQRVWEIYLQFDRWATRHGLYGDLCWAEGRPWSVGSRGRLVMLWPTPQEIGIKVVSNIPAQALTCIYHGNGITSTKLIEFKALAPNETEVRIRCDFVGDALVPLNSETKAVLQRLYEVTLGDLRAECETT